MCELEDIAGAGTLSTKSARTIEQKLSGEPARLDGTGTLVKPGELIDIVEMTPLTLNDRRIYNCLLANAWDTISDDKEHVIRKSDLRANDQSTTRLSASIERLMTAIVRVRLPDGRTLRVQLLGSNIEAKQRNGMFHYRFDSELRKIIANSNVFARIRTEVVFAFTSKYALALYEMIQKRGNLEHIWYETFELDDLRALLGVEEGKLTSFSAFRQRALEPAVKEVNALGDFGVSMMPEKTGKAVTHIKLMWHQKSVEELKEAYAELQRSRVGRQARIDGSVVDIRELEQGIIR